ncbi:hypothetical protein [uncultured phage cr106_1]|uniref:Uncharacterized protein n=1 Tax=uncultured phage cr106_1 TaxID=2772062 RepID=A0A7M1RV49_9CAUD|nr:hypothetical protein KNV29_gp104 [uncultured phage cr106_1]QOR58283.1 hypothetical protein [uncultured phage cr106_1]
MKVQVEDKSKIKDVHFKHPDLMSTKAKEYIIKEYYDIINLEESLDKARQEVRTLESTLKCRKAEFQSLSNMFEIEFENKEVEQVDRTEINGTIINPTDASRRSYTG